MAWRPLHPPAQEARGCEDPAPVLLPGTAHPLWAEQGDPSDGAGKAT